MRWRRSQSSAIGKLVKSCNWPCIHTLNLLVCVRVCVRERECVCVCVCVCVCERERERERECSSFLVCWSRSSLHIRWIIFPRCWVTVKLNILEPIYSIKSSESRTEKLAANFSSSKALSMKELRQKIIDLARQYTPLHEVWASF